MRIFSNIYFTVVGAVTTFCEFFSNLIALILRFWILTVFVPAGWAKATSFSTTIEKFKYEYDVRYLPLPPEYLEKLSLEIPSFPHEIAAYIATASELLLPVLLFLGLCGRIPALLLLFFNYVAAVSYPFLWTDAGLLALKDHCIWGMGLLFLVFKGSGTISLDEKIAKRNWFYSY